ncbi:LysR family transcriptional regulator [Sandaracinus amylolyticus]|uniref:LysR family transcriptional regulator n=1 Tax=Sandaracinus amylolyticus TaxID=927083 RepID=UPI001F29BB10|nr:LysR family transcriptional regulator [Sandaracinus amylolyticus]UJR80471.1 Transcriptional regulator [Sandaracinus amylolyticus]
MDLDLLRAFVAFAEHGTFAGAASALHVSQATLHGQIARLSEQLGVPLYRRVGRGVELTEDGVRVLAFARETDARIRGFCDELRAGASSQPVVLAAGEGAFLYLLGPAVRAFHAKAIAPLRLLTRSGPAALESVRRGEAQLAVTALPSVPDDLDAQVVAQVGAKVLIPRRHPLARKRALRFRDLAGERLIVPPVGAPHRDAIARAMEAEGLAWSPAVEAQGWELMAHFARMGLGLAIVNAFCRVPDGLHARPLRALPSVTYRVLSRRGAPLPRAAEALRAMITTKRAPS